MASERFDPRLLPLEVVGGVDLQGRPLPCGQEICTPLEQDCQEIGTDRDQAVRSCARLMGNQVLKERLGIMTETISSHEQLINRLSIDRNTGILTLNAHETLFEQLLSTGMLERLRNEGYVKMTTIGDIDLLKTHNSLGDHEGGDTALGEAAHRLKNLFRRDYDVVGVLECLDEAEQAVQRNGQFDMLSRFERGDELIVMSFIPPQEGEPPRADPRSILDYQVERITEAFSDVWVNYPVKEGLNYLPLQQAAAKRGFDFAVYDGRVVAPVSITFATVLSEIPTSMAEFAALKAAADASMMATKSMRQTIQTRGSAINLLQAA